MWREVYAQGTPGETFQTFLSEITEKHPQRRWYQIKVKLIHKVTDTPLHVESRHMKEKVDLLERQFSHAGHTNMAPVRVTTFCVQHRPHFAFNTDR